MFESIEDLVEDSVNLNYKTYPMLKGMLVVIEKTNNPEYYVLKETLGEIIVELEEFLSKIEASSTEEGGIDLNEFETRKFH